MAMKNILRVFLIFFLLMTISVSAFAQKQDAKLVFEAKTMGDTVKLRWVMTDKHFDYTYILYRAPGGQPDQRQQVTQLQIMDYKKAQTLLGDNEAALKLMFPFQTAKNRAELNQSLAQNDNRLNMLMYLSVLEPVVAEALGQYYEDTPSADGSVLYTLEVYKKGELVQTKTRGATLGSDKKLPMLWDVQAHRFAWGVGLKWQGYESYTSFNIYRSDMYDGKFTKVNSVPVQVQVSRNNDGTIDVAPYFYSDTTLKKGQRAFYQVRGLDFFADLGPESIAVMGQVKTDPRPSPLRRPEVKSGETAISLTWDKSVDDDVVGYNIYRSYNYEGKGEKLNAQLLATTSFTDAGVPLDINIFYAITAVNEGGYESLPSLNGHGLAKDATPPPVVQGVVTELDQATVKLRWDGVVAADLLGYRVYRTMKPESLDWALLNREPIVEQGFDDVLTKNLSRYPYYYRITALDSHYNESAPSEEVKVQLPDVIPPQVPGLTGSSVREGKVSLTWNNVGGHDLAGYNVYRSVEGKRVKITSQLVSQTAFTDIEPPVAVSVIYEVTAVDDAGNESNPSIPQNVQVRDHVAPTIAHFSAAMDKDKVLLTVISKDTDLVGFDVFRSRNNRDFIQINRDRVRDSTFSDGHVQKGKRYFYQILLWDQSANKTESVVRELVVK